MLFIYMDTLSRKFAIFLVSDQRGVMCSRNISDCSHFLMLVSIISALLTNIKFDEGWSIVKIRLQKVRLNFHRRNGPRCFESYFIIFEVPSVVK